MEKNKETYFFIINPHAGNGKGRRDWSLIESFLKNEGISYEYVFTEKKLHATEIAEKAITDGFRTLIAVGGDGTLNEIANGIFKTEFSSDVVLGMIPVGSGNDWCRMYGIPSDYEKAVDVIKRRNVFVQDAGLVKYKIGEENSERFFVNVAGLGFDAKVVQKTNRQKDKGRNGKMIYLMNLFTSLFSYKVADVKISVDKKELKTKLFSMNVGICKYSGGGMMQVPKAIADDGLFDVTVINKIGKLDVIRNVKNLYDGSFIKHKKVDTFRGKKISVDGISPVNVEVDGETVGHTPVYFSIIPKVLKIISA